MEDAQVEGSGEERSQVRKYFNEFACTVSNSKNSAFHSFRFIRPLFFLSSKSRLALVNTYVHSLISTAHTTAIFALFTTIHIHYKDTMTELTNVPGFAPYDQDTALSIPPPVDIDIAKRDSIEDTNPHSRDSGVFFNTEDVPRTPSSRLSAASIKSSLSIKSPQLYQSDSSTRRLCRPAEMNLGTTPNSKRPKSELELRFDLIRNSQSQSKAALRSPTQLLNDRLNMSPKKAGLERVRVFTPPKPMLNGCILPGPTAQMEAFKGWSVRGHTEKSNRPTWWCKYDKVVVFDGAEEVEGEEVKFKVRTSKGLTIARRRGDTETVVIPMNCNHCQEMLNRSEWKYDVQVCKRTVCWDCKERCKWELEQEKNTEESKSQGDDKTEVNRTRADSVLEDEPVQEDLMTKIGIMSPPKTPIGNVGGIEERMGQVESI
ncbi:unnamed protein product [Periconia digitata]|uniref:Uncharacterized protein n=1 Tax=Periconia digitata TaxID=1303443 RepID=A0A9W4XKM6_9PLEO|nr:unnamed protein product [Periconia digitata]